MSTNLLNSLGAGMTPASVGADNRLAVANKNAGPFYGCEILASPFGHQDSFHDDMAKRISSWKLDTIGAGAANSFGLTAPTATDPLLLTVVSGTGGSNTGQQAQGSDGSTATALARFFARTDNLIHFETRFKVSAVGANCGSRIIGLANITTTLQNAGATVNAALTDGIYFYHTNGSSILKAVVRRAGVNNVDRSISTTLAADTWYTLGFRFNTNGISWFLDGVEVGDDFGGAAWSPNAAMTPSLSVIGGNATTRSITVQRLSCFQEAI
jgi:hypothetical protein